VSYAAYAATTVGFAFPKFKLQPELRNERASKLGLLDPALLDPRQRLNS